MRISLLVLSGVLIVRLGWIGDDAFVTMRTALNWTHGWGPGFNATEAVQGYTHPLWFILWSAVGSITNHWILGILMLSVVLSLTAIAIVLWSAGSMSCLVICAGLLILSNAFMDYTTSGLEVPLAYAITACLLLLTIRGGGSVASAVAIGALSAGLLLTRLDLALLIAPAILLTLWE